ncbi:MAG: CinA family protein [Nitrospirae bacterium]|nr:CinA family protein [Nitrospirota bacterium]
MGKDYPREIIELVKRLHQVLLDRHLSLSTAESCTGGKVADLITEVPGASRFFKGSIVAYWVEIKKNVLGVSGRTIQQKGVVSPETAGEMAERVRKILNTDIGLSTTGNLGPEALEGKDVGLVYLGVSISGTGTWTRELKLKGTRQDNKLTASLEALKFLLNRIDGETS